MGRAPSVLSMVRVTSARPSGARPAVPAKITSSILPPRSALAPCSPSTHAIASTTLDLPDPFGPTTQVIPGSSFRVVADAKDLKPLTVRLLRCTGLRRVGMVARERPGLGQARGYRALGTQPRNATHLNPDEHSIARRPPCGIGARSVFWCAGFGWSAPRRVPGSDTGRSGQRRLPQAQQIGSRRSRGEPIVLGTQPG